jgi:tyrosyl-tRNA synthetase
MVNNHDWLGKLGYIELLQSVGTHFTINRMLTFDSVKLRLDREQPMTFLEFNYMILQGLRLSPPEQGDGRAPANGRIGPVGQHHQRCRTDPPHGWARVFGLTTPLSPRPTAARWARPLRRGLAQRSAAAAYDYWQFWRNTDDRDVGKFLRLFTDVPLDEIARLEALEGSEINAAKDVLANEATKLCRGEDAAQRAAETARATFAEGSAGADLPTITVAGDDIALVDALADLGLVASKGEAKRLIKGGGARVDGEQVKDEAARVTLGAEPVRVSAGKKLHGLVVRA